MANLDRLCTSGNFVVTPNDKTGMVRSFDARTNEVLVQFGATSQLDALAKGGLDDDYIVQEGLGARYHFTKLRPAR